MSEYLMMWVGQLSVSLLDFIIMFIVSYALMRKRISVSKQHVVFGVIFAIISSLAFYSLDGWSAQIISHLLLLIMFKKIIERANIQDMFIIYLIWFVTAGVIQAFFLALLSVLPLEQSAIFLIGQLITTGVIFVIYKTFKWDRVFHAIRSNILLKFSLFVLFLMMFILVSIINFELIYAVFSAIAIIFIAVAFFPVLAQLYHKSAGNISIEEIKTDLLTTAIDMVEEANPQLRYQRYTELAKQYGIDFSKLSESKRKSDENQLRLEREDKRIKQFIQAKLANIKKEIDIDSEITYYEQYQNIDIDFVISWLDQLINHASEVAINGKMFTYILSTKNRFTLKFSYECGEEGEQGISKEFHELHTQVISIGGEFRVDEDQHFLQISIKLK